MTDEAMSPLRRRMIEDMTIRKLGRKTQQDYIQIIKRSRGSLPRLPIFWIAVAEPVRRETDRHDPTGMSRPRDRIWGGASAPDPGSVCRVL
jgi:integrase/recombinase XerD